MKRISAIVLFSILLLSSCSITHTPDEEVGLEEKVADNSWYLEYEKLTGVKQFEFEFDLDEFVIYCDSSYEDVNDTIEVTIKFGETTYVDVPYVDYFIKIPNPNHETVKISIVADGARDGILYFQWGAIPDDLAELFPEIEGE